jgi:energy-coupling factor transport system permease protein
VKAFGKVHPIVLMFYFLSVLIVAMFSSNPVLSLTALLGGILFCCMLVRRRAVAGDIGFYVPLFLLIAITNPLFSHNGVTPLFFLNGNPVTLEAFLYGGFMAVVVVGVLLWCRGYSEVMTSDKFLYLFGGIIPKLSLVLSMALRFVPQFRRQMGKVRQSQKVMGLYAGRGITDRVRSAGRVFLAMIAWSLENSMETAASMKARGYGRGRRTNFSLFRFTVYDGVLLAVCSVLMGITAVGMAAGITSFRFYPRVSELNLSWTAAAVYISFGVLSVVPFAIEVREAIVWTYCRSRI